MSEEHDSKISGLYQISSQESPPPHIDRAVLAMARKSVRRRTYSPFGNHWVAGGAMVGVVVLSVLLILTVPLQPGTYAPEDDGIAYLSEQQPGESGEYNHREILKSEVYDRKDKVREEPGPHAVLPGMEVVIPDAETQAGLQPAPVSTEPARPESTRAASVYPPSEPLAEDYYLQAGLFREQADADAFKTELTELGFKCEIQKVSIDNANVYHRVHVGPFTDFYALDISMKKLRELGFETQVVTNKNN